MPSRAQGLQKILANWSVLLLIWGLLLASLHSCLTDKKEARELYAPTIYAGDSSEAAAVRAQSTEKIACDDARFDEMFCLFDRDMHMLIEHCLEKQEAAHTWEVFKENEKDAPSPK